MQATESLSSNKKGKKNSLSGIRIDMTPMVDLGFLLITFFIFTTTLGEKKGLSLVMPVPEGPPSVLNERHALSMVLGSNDEVFVYRGSWDESVKENTIVRTDYNLYGGAGKLIRARQKELYSYGSSEEKDDLVLLIKPLEGSTYNNLVNALDEAMINGVKKFMVVSPTAEEINYFKQLNFAGVLGSQ